MANSGSDAGDRNDESKGPGVPKPDPRPAPPAAPPRVSLTDFDVPTRERPGVTPKATAPAPEPQTDASALGDSVGMLDEPSSEPRMGEPEMPPDVAAAWEAAISEAPPEAPVDAASDESFLTSASMKADEARSAVAESAARMRREREVEEKAARERARQARQPETLEQKRQRMLLRLRTIREAMRLLGFMDLPNSAHAELDDALVELEDVMLPDAAAAEVRPAPEALDAAIQQLDSAALDRMERALTQLEDVTLQADASVTRDVFRGRAFSGKHSRKTLTRHGRLLASRRFSADGRRDRFEALAMHLLTEPDAEGRLAMLPKDQARTVLQHLIGGLPQLGADRDREDALTYLKDALARLAEFPSAEEFFKSGFFLDVHGYKVSMRDQLTSPDFLYLSALLGARIHNRLEGWIAEKEQDLKANQLAQDGGPRERILGKLREQEDEVRSIFGADASTGSKEVVGVKRAAPKKSASQTSTEREAEKEKWRKRKEALAAKKSGERPWYQTVPVLAGVIVVCALIVLRSTGNLEIRTHSVVDAATLRAYSPLLVRGYMALASHEFMGEVKMATWEALGDKERTQAAEEIAAKLSAAGIETAELRAYKAVVIRIEARRVAFVQHAPR